MNWIIEVFLGIALSFFGGLPMGMINMSVFNIVASHGLKAGLWVAAGAATLEFFQTIVAYLLSDVVLLSNQLSTYLHYFTLVLFVILAAVYLLKKPTPPAEVPSPTATIARRTAFRFYGYGAFLGSVNFLTVPYWLIYIIYLKSNGLLQYGYSSMIVFALSAAIGWFLLLYAYARGGQYVIQRFQYLQPRLNTITGGVFVILALVEVYKIYQLSQ